MSDPCTCHRMANGCLIHPTGIGPGMRVRVNRGKHHGQRGTVTGFDEQGLIQVLLDGQQISTRRWSVDPEDE